MKGWTLIAVVICIFFSSCASSDLGQERENYRQTKKIQRQAERSNKVRGYDTNHLGNTIDR